MPRASVAVHHGTPTVFIDGEPVFYRLMWTRGPEPEGWSQAAAARAAARAGIHYYAFDIGQGWPHSGWVDPRPGRDVTFDFSVLDPQLALVTEADPRARFHLRPQLECLDPWWPEVFPEECEVDNLGQPHKQSFASVVWRDQARRYLRELIAFLDRIGCLERVVAIQPCGGSAQEWAKGETCMTARTGDYSRPMRDHLRRWLQERYGGDAEALRVAWRDPKVTFATALVPAHQVQMATTRFTFRDPVAERPVIDYYHCFAELLAELTVDFCRTVKEATKGECLAGVFYGYLMEFSWNDGYHTPPREDTVVADSSWNGHTRSGHLGLRQVLASPYVDFLVSPYSYGFRGIGGVGAFMSTADSVRIHHKVWISEDDTRTHLTHAAGLDYARARTSADSVAILRRNFHEVLQRGAGIWWLSGSGSEKLTDAAAEPAFEPLLRRFVEIGQWAATLDREPSAEVAVFLDEESLFYQSNYNNLDLPAIFQQRLWGLARFGAPYDLYLLHDLATGLVRDYKLYVFLNPWRVDRKTRDGIARQVRRDRKVAVWMYGSGIMDGEFRTEHMTHLTGFRFGESQSPWGPMMLITDTDHPITAGLPADLQWGTNSLLSPCWHVEDPEATTVGQLVYSVGRCLPGMAVKEMADWTSVYIGVPNVPAPVLRGLARFAGAHLFSEAGDVLHATRQLLGIHTATGGERQFRLPGVAGVVYDLYGREVIGQEVDRFSVQLPRASSALYYFGDPAALASLDGSIASTKR